MSPLIVVLTAAACLALFVWTGLRVKPKPISLPGLIEGETPTVPLPAGLPGPVERFYRAVYGDQIPLIRTAILRGRGRIRPFGLWLPIRFIFAHNVGRDYRHLIEATFFRIPILKVDEGYIGGVSYFKSPMGSYTNNPNTNQAANLALWAEACWFPSAWLTDPRVGWREVDDQTALLQVPFENHSETFVVRFDPVSGMIAMMEAMRYREPGAGKAKILWITRNEPGRALPGTKLDATGSATWLDQGKPWAYFEAEEIVTNADLSDIFIRQQ